MNRDLHVPPPFTPWAYSASWAGRWRNRLGYAVGDAVTRPIFQVLRAYREAWGLPPYRSAEDSFSSLAIISQQPREFDFPRHGLPPQFHYVGPLRRPLKTSVPFPWERLTGVPLIYGSLGTLQGSKSEMFRIMAEACRDLPVQLVLSHGRSLSEPAIQELSRLCMVVPYAPQLELLARACLTLTHGGLNTVLDSLSQGVPMIVMPISYEQPAIAARVQWAGVGRVIPLASLTTNNLRRTLQEMFQSTTYLERARSMANSIGVAGGVRKAADIIDAALANVH